MTSSATVKENAINENALAKTKFSIFDDNFVKTMWSGVSVVNSLGNLTANYTDGLEDVTGNLDKLAVVNGESLTTDRLVCQTCVAEFQNEDEYRHHYRLDWHRYNLKAKLKGRAVLTEEQFAQLDDDVSSISGSDSETEVEEEREIALKGNPRLAVRNSSGQYMTLYKCLLYAKKNRPESQDEIERLLRNLPHSKKWSVIMLGGGHFAAAIFNGSDVKYHKTFHSYTVRAKQGGSQSSRDNKSGGGTHPRSAGASLRRYNEAAFNQHVRDTMDLWKSELDQCQLIFYRAVSSNQSILFGNKNPLFLRDDPRLRSIPFPTRRATYKEVLRVRNLLATVEIIDEVAAFLPKSEPKLTATLAQASKLDVDTVEEENGPEEPLEEEEEDYVVEKLKKAKKKSKKKKPVENPPADEVLEVELFPGEKEIRAELVNICAEGSPIELDTRMSTLKDIFYSHFGEFQTLLREFVNQRVDADCATFLHKAAVAKNGDVVWKLLELGSDPALVDAYGKTPYIAAGDKDTRNVFRRFMGTYPDRYDYSKAQIPSALTDEAEKQRAARLAEKRKLQREQRKEKKAEEKTRLAEERRIEEERKKQEEERQRFLSLSDREKRALAAERRLLAAASGAGGERPILARCFLCGQDMSGKVPFDYSGNKFCSIQCLQAHRKTNPQNKN